MLCFLCFRAEQNPSSHQSKENWTRMSPPIAFEWSEELENTWNTAYLLERFYIAPHNSAIFWHAMATYTLGKRQRHRSLHRYRSVLCASIHSINRISKTKMTNQLGIPIWDWWIWPYLLHKHTALDTFDYQPRRRMCLLCWVHRLQQRVDIAARRSSIDCSSH